MEKSGVQEGKVPPVGVWGVPTNPPPKGGLARKKRNSAKALP
jgi:hypothetical protein